MSLAGQMCLFSYSVNIFKLLLYTNDSGEKWGKEETQQGQREGTDAANIKESESLEPEGRILQLFPMTWITG